MRIAKLIRKVWRKLFAGIGISILVPYNPSPDNQRVENWDWLHRYWRSQLPWAQIVVGTDYLSLSDPCVPFSKSAAVNEAASRASGDIFVIVDADGYIDTDAVLTCAKKIRKAREFGRRLWFVPYRQFYRLTQNASKLLLWSDPCNPKRFSYPPPDCDIQNTSGSQFGHWYGALIQIVPREGFEEIGGWDERFRGWGGEDHSAMRAMDTLYWPHKTLPSPVFHVWHPMLTPGSEHAWVDPQYRTWQGQKSICANDSLTSRYTAAYGDVKRMRKLVDEGRSL